jgi:hypothetical protein
VTIGGDSVSRAVQMWNRLQLSPEFEMPIRLLKLRQRIVIVKRKMLNLLALGCHVEIGSNPRIRS